MHDLKLVKAEDIARLLKMSTRHVAERITYESDFPKPFVFNGKGSRRWLAEEVEEWVRGRQLRS